DERLSEAVFLLKAGQVSSVVETADGIYIVKVIERTEAHAPEYKDAATKVKERIVFEKSSEEAKKKADELLKKVKDGADLTALAKAEKLNVEETGFFRKADGFIPKIGAQPSEKLFDMKADSPNYPELISRNNRLYILKFKTSEEAAETGLVSKKEALKEALLMKKQDDALKNWITDLKAKAKIEVFAENL
ncbi:peptidyl-prolyl cis-trans isomerase, partial [bacterium]